MTMQARTVSTKAQPPLTMCTEPGCPEPAVYSFVWPWGAGGACCDTHRTHVAQKSEQLGYPGGVQFVALDPGRTPPLTRDERTQLIAARMSAEQDAVEAKARGGELYQDNVRMADEVRRLRARNAELEAQVRDRQGDIEGLKKERDTALADAHEAAADAARLRPLVGKPNPFVAPAGNVTPGR